MPTGALENLPTELIEIVKLGWPIYLSEPSPNFLLIQHKKRTFVMGSFEYGSTSLEELFPANSDIVFKEILRYEGPWSAEKRTIDVDFFEILSSLSYEELAQSAKRVSYHWNFNLIVTDGNLMPKISESTAFPAWGVSTSRNFFKDREISTGFIWCNSVRDTVIDLISRPKNRHSINYWQLDCYENELVYDAAAGIFILTINLKQELNETFSDLVGMIARLEEFFFVGLEQFIKAEDKSVTLAKHLASNLGLAMDDPFIALADEEYFDTFVDDSRKFASKSYQWVTPDAIRFRVRKEEIDPSFGTATENSWKHFELLEYGKNWSQTDIKKLNASAYLKRLSQQASEHPGPPISLR
jgi:hypothetical protein